MAARMKQGEFEAILKDSTKSIPNRIQWSGDEDHYPCFEFSADIESQLGYPIVLKGSYNPEALTLTFAVIHRKFGRIYGLDLGKSHKNPDQTRVGEKHKHTWKEECRDKSAYVPEDITIGISDIEGVWDQFCKEAKITHSGLDRPPEHQLHF